MIYASKERAIEIAAELTRDLKGNPPSYACRTAQGWTVICSWLPLTVGMFGILELAQ